MIHALPGMGADHRMFPGPWRELPGFVAHDWMPFSGERTVKDVARSMCRVCGIQDGDVLMGASLGGMVACEIAKVRKLRGLFLVGSAVSADEIRKPLKALHPLAQILPIEWLRFSAGSIPLELTRMFASMDGDFVRAMCDAVFEWEGLGPTEVPVWRLHGKFDAVIAPPKQPELMLAGGHLISITHAAACVEFVKTCLVEMEAPSASGA